MHVPNAKTHNPDPAYLRGLIARIGWSQRECALRVGVSERHMRAYLTVGGRRTPAPYAVQYALESMVVARERGELYNLAAGKI
jgi:hypothetical protein